MFIDFLDMGTDILLLVVFVVVYPIYWVSVYAFLDDIL